MRETGILFTPENIRKIAVTKTKWQTRRVITPQPSGEYLGESALGEWAEGLASMCHVFPGMQAIKDKKDSLRSHKRIFPFRDSNGHLFSPTCQYGRPGDKLYIKEGIIRHVGIPELIGYYMDGCRATEPWMERRTAMFMPKWAARYWLEITDVKVERVQDISAADALAEGISKTDYWKPKEVEGKPFEEKWWDDYEFWQRYPQIAYSKLWDSINGKKYPWSSNPWTFAISFKLLKPGEEKQQ